MGWRDEAAPAEIDCVQTRGEEPGYTTASRFSLRQIANAYDVRVAARELETMDREREKSDAKRRSADGRTSTISTRLRIVQGEIPVEQK